MICFRFSSLYCGFYIGNGPSGITLSYMLAGNWPYWSENDVQRHPDELLSARLCYADADKSLVEQDLIQLAEGLEGRSTNPVSLLVSIINLILTSLKFVSTFHLEYGKTIDATTTTIKESNVKHLICLVSFFVIVKCGAHWLNNLLIIILLFIFPSSFISVLINNLCVKCCLRYYY